MFLLLEAFGGGIFLVGRGWEVSAHFEGGRGTKGRRSTSQGPEKGQKDAVLYLLLVVSVVLCGEEETFGMSTPGSTTCVSTGAAKTQYRVIQIDDTPCNFSPCLNSHE